MDTPFIAAQYSVASSSKSKRRPWTREEKKAVDEELGTLIRRMKVPGKLDCDRCLRNKSILSKRTWKDIKYYVHNTIQSVNRRYKFSK